VVGCVVGWEVGWEVDLRVYDRKEVRTSRGGLRMAAGTDRTGNPEGPADEILGLAAGAGVARNILKKASIVRKSLEK
jgi:hypothetical protein